MATDNNGTKYYAAATRHRMLYAAHIIFMPAITFGDAATLPFSISTSLLLSFDYAFRHYDYADAATLFLDAIDFRCFAAVAYAFMLLSRHFFFRCTLP